MTHTAAPAITLTTSDILRILEFRTKIVSVSSFLIGTAYAVLVSGHASWLPLAAAALVAVVELARIRGPSFSHQAKPLAMAGISRAFLAYTLAMLVAIALGIAKI